MSLTKEQLETITKAITTAITTAMTPAVVDGITAATGTMQPKIEDTVNKAVKDGLKDLDAKVSDDANQKISAIATKVDELNKLSEIFNGVDPEAVKNFFSKAEVDRLKQEKEEEEKADKDAKLFSAKNLKTAGMVVGGIILIAGVAHIVRRVFFSADGSVESVEATPAAAPDLEMVANY